MTTVEEATTHKAVISRTYSASANRIFDAWTKPEVLAKWFMPNERWAGAEAEIDLQVGGHYRITMRHSDGDGFTVAGVYKEIDRPKKLVFTWIWENNPMADNLVETLVTVDLRTNGGETQLTLTHEGFLTAESATSHTEGWTGILGTLDGYLEKSAS